MKTITAFFCFFCIFTTGITFAATQGSHFYLKENLKEAQVGDFIVVSFGKTLTLMHIYDKTSTTLTVEEVSVLQKKSSD